MIVLKFGGTSMGDADAIARAARIVADRRGDGAVVVVSAMAGTTNALLELAEQAAEGQLIVALRIVEQLRERHLDAADELLGDSEGAGELLATLSVHCDELASLAEALSVLAHLTPRSLDTILAYGEQLSSLLATAALRRAGMPVQEIDPRDLLITDDQFGRAEPQFDAIQRAAREHVLPLLSAGVLPVLGGFVGATPQRVTTTLGRGGSDYSASLVGAALDARAIEIWTDVDGMLTGDPRVVEGARLIEHIRFDEAAELAAFGAKVLHPSTIAPAVRRGIPVFIYNSRRPEGHGTRITASAPLRGVTAIAGKGNVTIVKVRSARMLLAHGVLRRIFSVFERHRVSVDVVATSEVSVSMTVDDPARLESLVVDLRQFGDVILERQRAVLSLVGSGMGGNSRTMARALAALGDMRVHMLSLSATEINLTLIVDGDQLEPGLRALHDEFFGAPAGGTVTPSSPATASVRS